MSDHTNKDNENDSKLEDILSSIKGIIENRGPFVDEQSNGQIVEDDKIAGEAVLELTSEVNSQSRNISADNQDALISPDAQEKAEIEFKRFAESVVNAEITNDKVDSLDDRVNQIMRPLIKDWLDNNLPRIVEKVVSKELKRIIPKT